jgi:hypothetical protein
MPEAEKFQPIGHPSIQLDSCKWLHGKVALTKASFAHKAGLTQSNFTLILIER